MNISKIGWLICIGLGAAQADDGHAGTAYEPVYTVPGTVMVLPANTVTTGPLATGAYDPEPDDSDSDDLLLDDEDEE